MSLEMKMNRRPAVLRSGFTGDPLIHREGSFLRRVGSAALDIGRDIISGQPMPPMGDIPTVPPGPTYPQPRDPLNGRMRPNGFVAGPLPTNGPLPLPPLPPPPPGNGITAPLPRMPDGHVELGLEYEATNGQEENEIQILQASVLPVVGARTLATAILQGGRAFIAKLAALIRRNPGTTGVLGGMSASQLVEWVRRQRAPQVDCPSGFRPNKTSYFLRDGTFVLEGSTCVKIRRRNPLNPKAADRAISRVEAGKRAIDRFRRITIRPKKC